MSRFILFSLTRLAARVSRGPPFAGPRSPLQTRLFR